MTTNGKKRIARYLSSSALTRPLITVGAVSAALAGTAPAHALDASALPQDPTLAGGNATFAQSGKTLNVNQTSNRAVIDWRSFNIGSEAQTNFNQPNSGSIAVNRVNASANASQIEGGLHANGQVWILNPNGVMFGKTAHVDVAGIVASTANIDAGRFMAGDNRLNLTGADKGSVVNDGSITVGNSGLAAFVAPSVRNSGTITARVGKIALAAGSTFTLDLAGDQLVEIGLGAGKAVVDQSGKIVNPGGTVTLTARAAGQVVDSVVNMSGVTRTASARKVGGDIVLGGDTVNVAGTADASGTSGGNIAITGKTINVASSAVLRSDAGANGDGGTIKSVASVQGNYAGSYSAKGGSASGNGGKIETSGKTAHIDSEIQVNTLAANGKAGNWTLDPDYLTVTDGASNGSIDPNASTVTNGTIQNLLATTGVTLAANNSITVGAAIDTHTQNSSTTLSLNDQNGAGLTVNLNAPITLGVNQHLTGQGTLMNVASTGLIQNGIDVALAGATVNVAAGIYGPNVNINKSHLSLIGATGAEIDIPTPADNTEVRAITVSGGDGVTISGFKIRGEITGSYVNFAFNNGKSEGIYLVAGATNVTISGNDIQNVRTGILVDGYNSGSYNTGSITNNLIDNTKGAVAVQWSDANNNAGQTLSISGNRQGTVGNEWGVNFHLQGPHTGTPLPAVQQALLDNSAANAGWSVQDQAYATSNRTAVTVAASATNTNANPSDSNQGSYRAPLATIQAGITAVVSGGTVNVQDGTYVIANNAPYININKSLSLIGQSQSGTKIDARTANTYGLRISGPNSNVTVQNFTLYGVTSGTFQYGLKAENVNTLTLRNITSRGAGKSEFDLNGIVNGTLTNLMADGAPVSDLSDSTTTAGNGISLTNSQNIALTNVTTKNNAWGGLALYQGTTYGDLQLTGITVDGTNTFNEVNGIYAQDQSSATDIGAIDLSGQGILYIAQLTTPLASGDGTYTKFQKTEQGAIDQAAVMNAGYTVTGSTVQGYAGSGVAGNNSFSVGFATGGTAALSIQAAVNAANAGGTVNVRSGTYSEALNIGKNLTIAGAGIDQTIIKPTTLLTTNVGHKYDSNVKTSVFVHGASAVTLSGLTVDGNNLGNNAVVFWNNASGAINNVLIKNPQAFNGVQTGQDLAVDATGTNTVNLAVSGATFANWNKNAIDVVTGNGALTGGGNVNLTVSGSSFTGQGTTGANAQNGILLWARGGGTVNGTVDSSTFSGLNYTGDNVAAGVLMYGSSGALTVKNSTFTGIQKYIALDGGSPNTVDATTGNTFDGVAQGAATLSQLFAIEDHMLDKLDNSANGLIRFAANQVFVTAAKGNVQAGVDAASIGDTVRVQDGTYVIPTTLSVNKSISLVGQSQLGTILNASGATTYSLRVQADNVSLSNFTLLGSTVTGTYGIKVEPLTLTDPNSRINNFAINNVTINGSDKSGLDINGAVTATINNVTAKNAANGVGIAIVDSSNVTVTNSTTQNNAWGGIRIEEKNATSNGLNQQTHDISVDASNTLTETVPLYLEDDSTSQNFGGAITIGGLGFVVLAPNNPNDIVAWFQKTQQAAVNFATNTSLNGGHVNLPTATVQGYNGSGITGNNSFTVGTGNSGVQLSLTTAYNAATSGATINLLSGTYALASQFNIAKSLSLIGAGVGNTTITSASTGYGLNVTADNVRLSSFTFSGPTAVNSATYGIKVQPDTGVASDRILGFKIDNVTINRGNRTGLDLNGALGATIDNVSVSNIVNGNGIALTDSANVIITNTKTSNNAWGGLALYQTNRFYDQQVTGITVDASNNFSDVTPVYAEDQSLTKDIGTLALAGFNYVVKSPNLANDVYTWFQKTQQAAVDYATNVSLSLGNVNLPTATVQGYGGSGVAGNNIFTVGIGSNGTAMSIQTALNAATTGATLNILSGSYTGSIVANGATNFNFGTVSLGGSFTLNGASTLSGNLSASSIALNGAVILAGATTLNTSAANGNVTTASIDGGQNLTISAGTGTVSLGSLGATTRLAAFTDNSATTLTGGTYNAGSLNFAGALTLNAATTLNASGGIVLAAVNGSGQNLAVNAGTGTTLTGGTYSANNLSFGGALTLNAATTLNASGKLVLAAVNGSGQNLTANAGTGITLTGGSYNAGSLNFGGALTLTAATTTLNAANGIVTASIDGSTAGGQALAINAGSGQVFLGSLGAGTRLGAFTDASATTLTGSTYNANSLNFASDVTLTAATTTMDTSPAAGDITVSGNIFGTSDGKQNLILTAGSGTGNAASNGNILLQSVGVKGTLALGDLTISGNNFGAQTVSVGNFKAKLTGNQVFSSHTLNATSVDSTVGGSASGPINSAGAVGLAVTGDVTGAIVGHAVILNAGSITGATVTGTDTISVTANSVGTSTLSAPTVSAKATTFNTNVNATNVTLNADTITGSTITGSQNITITANNVGSSTLTAPSVAAVANNFNSAVNASNTANISGGTVGGTFTGGSFTLVGSNSVNATVSAKSTNVTSAVISGSYSGAAVSLSGSSSVNATVASDSLSVSSPSGKLAGTWASLDTGGSGTLVVNNQVSVGTGNTNPNQIVVENFVLPAGTRVTASGAIVLPQGLVIGLLSPGGGANSVPKLIQVQDVYSLGALLSSGYTAIIIDLSGTKKSDDKSVRLSMN